MQPLIGSRSSPGTVPSANKDAGHASRPRQGDPPPRQSTSSPSPHNRRSSSTPTSPSKLRWIEDESHAKVLCSDGMTPDFVLDRLQAEHARDPTRYWNARAKTWLLPLWSRAKNSDSWARSAQVLIHLDGRMQCWKTELLTAAAQKVDDPTSSRLRPI